MKSIASRLHILFNEQKRFSFPFKQQTNEIPENGIYNALRDKAHSQIVTFYKRE